MKVDYFKIPCGFREKITLDLVMKKWIAACRWDKSGRRLFDCGRQCQKNIYELAIVIDGDRVTCRVFDRRGPYGEGNVLLIAEKYGQRQYDWGLNSKQLAVFKGHYFGNNA